MSSISAWGVDHGEEVSKAAGDQRRKHVNTSAALGGLVGPAGSAVHAGVTAKDGKKLRAVGNAGGGAAVGAAGGALLGSKLGSGGITAGSMLGGAGGAMAGARRNTKRGYIKGVKKG